MTDVNDTRKGDYRIVQFETTLASKAGADANLDSFFTALRAYPFRSNYSALIMA